MGCAPREFAEDTPCQNGLLPARILVRVLVMRLTPMFGFKG